MGSALTGIFSNGVMGMMAFSEAMGTISDNIANQNTIGYKRVETQFSTLIPGQGALRRVGADSSSDQQPTRNTSGVKTTTRQFVSLQGQILQTGRPLDLAINGGGMFVFANGTITGGVLTPEEFFYSRAGSLRAFVPPVDTGGVLTPGTDSFLANEAGQFLMGFAATAPTPGQAATTVTAPTDINQLVPIQISSQAGSSFSPTTAASLSAVIPAPGSAVGASVTSPVLNVTDADDLTLLVPPPVVAGDTFDITLDIDGTLTTYSFTIAAGETIAGLEAAINAAGNPDVFASITGSANNATLTLASPYEMTLTDTLGASATDLFDLAASPTTFTATTAPDVGTPIFYIDANGARQGVTLQFTDPVTVTGTGTIWNVSAVDSAGTVVAGVPVTFDGNGQAIAGTSQSFTIGADTFTVDIENVAMLGVATSGNQALQVSYDQDGLELSTFVGLDIESDGSIVGRFSSGGTVPLYHIPIATFVEANKLLALNGNMYQETEGSGGYELRLLGDDFASLEVGSIEQSNVDLSDSFSQMILIQRAYSTAATVVRTADEMSVVVRDLLR